MIGGTVADIWSAEECEFVCSSNARVCLPMDIFSATALGGLGLVLVFFGWIETDYKLGWRWIQRIQLM